MEKRPRSGLGWNCVMPPFDGGQVMHRILSKARGALYQPFKQLPNSRAVDIGEGDAHLALTCGILGRHEHGAGQHQHGGIAHQFRGQFV